ncbi:MAG: sulfur oxidation c-type cytochrome SoxA [Pseudomonadota bacterium]
MKILRRSAIVALSVSMVGAVAFAGPDDDKLVIEGETIVTDVKAPAGSPLDHIYSGWRFRSDETQSLQTDDFENPAFAAIENAIAQFDTVDGKAGKSCADCHSITDFEGLRTQLPRWNEELGKPETLEMIINRSRTEHMQAEPWKWEAPEMLGMTAYIGLQSRGQPVDVDTEGPMAEWAAKGKELYYTRVGQLNMSCAQCHEANYGKMIRADHLSQGQVNGFPVYRLKWGGLGSSHRRFKGCMRNIRAEPYQPGSDEFIALELYVASRGEGLSVETPSVRN